MKKFLKISLILLGISILTVSCGKKEEKMEEVLLCENNSEKYVFSFDEDGYVNSIYYETIFDFNDNLTEEEIEDINSDDLFFIDFLKWKMLECADKNYACYSSYDYYKIINKYYVKSEEEAESAELDEYYDVSYYDVREKVIENEDATCKKIEKNDKYTIHENKTEIKVDDKDYTSLKEMEYEMTKPAFFKEYTLAEIDNKKATIEFKDNGVCKINLKDFDYESWGGIYCDNDKHRIIGKATYLGGNCTYEVDDYKFEIKYDGKYESGKYCETYEDKKSFMTYDVVETNRQIIELEFDENYTTFEYLNGAWGRKYGSRGGPLSYAKKYMKNE